jgi:Transcriptional regulator
MAQKTKEQLVKLKGNKRAQIMDAALKLFAEHGYLSTPVSQIAKEAGVAKGLIYSYFENKEDILRSITRDGIDDIFSALGESGDKALTSDEEVIAVMDRIFDRVLDRAEFYKLYYSMFLHPHVMESFQDEMEEIAVQMVTPFLDYFAAKGYEDPQSVILFMHATADGLIFNSLFNPDIFKIEKIKPVFFNLLTKGKL